ncbi:FadR/GntR family transcriptional regulator [Streptomyces gilvus]|uniref:FadR/GntR family transcriptional regulator n=1 Tax=Streptomyces gilvus TaxID=2920937 RepID=UPI001F0F47A2|nr:FCD domain-containing protein [Streptomyces sp. CME 23]MCH5675599.1 FCD domain-containing protein [Streptomyces sp. CME 23]
MVGRQVRVPKMAELIAGHLRKQIVRGELTEGEALPAESELMAQFNVSRPTLREAFRILESESLITVRRGAHGGARVQLPAPEVAARYAALILQHRATTLQDLYEARILIEPPCVGLLAETAAADTVKRLRAALDEHDSVTGDPTRSIQIHIAFHSLLIELTGNQTLVLLMSLVENIIQQANVSQVESTAGTAKHERASRKGLAAHHRIVDLIEARDAEATRQLWRKHLTEARDYLVRADITTVLDLMG